MARTSARRARSNRRSVLPPGAWHMTESVWGDSQRVRLVTGPTSLASDSVFIRSIHAVAFLGEEPEVLLVQNRDRSFTFPGGRVEGSETLDETLAREIWEEARALLKPGHQPFAITRIEFLNRVPGRIQRVHPTYLSWVVGEVAELSNEPHHDPAHTVVGRHVFTAAEAMPLLDPLEQVILNAALTVRGLPCISIAPRGANAAGTDRDGAEIVRAEEARADERKGSSAADARESFRRLDGEAEG